jgi:hypothetical protein
MKHFYLSFVLLLLTVCTYSQYAQNFDTLINTGTGTHSKLPDGWAIYEVESGTGTQGEGKYAVGTGSSNTGNTYSFGVASGDPERALGSIASNTLSPTFGAIFFNEVDSVITTITITYTGEQWRYGGRTTGTRDNLLFDYSLDATGLITASGSWTRVAALDFVSPTITGTAPTVLNGNLAANRQTITYSITGLSLQPGESIIIRWSDVNIASNDDGLAIDDFQISTGLAPGVMTSGGTNTGGGGGGGGTPPNNNSTSNPIFRHKVQTDSSFVHLYGNLHGHSTHSDGKASTLQPADDYNYARGAQGMDFLGISEHNHSTAGMQIANYKTGAAQADAANGQLNAAGQPFIALHGMEWGTISGGGHALVYGFKDSLINWETGNYDIYVPKSDYIALFDKVRTQPGAVAFLAHPKSSDYTGLTGGYKGVADSAVVSVAVESGPAFSTSTTYNDYPSSLSYINYYRSLLKQGYRVGAHMDQDNHEMTFGTANGNRMVVLSADRSREGLIRGMQAMRIYASNDYNASVNFSINNYILGSSILSASNLTGMVSHVDADGEGVTAIQLYGGKVGGGDAALIDAGTTATLNFTTAQAEGETWYYYAIITQGDGNKIVTSPIWLTRAAGAPLPVRLLNFTAALQGTNHVRLQWQTADEVNSDHFIVERSTDMNRFSEIGKISAKGSNSSYSLIDGNAIEGLNYYRLRQVDKNGQLEYSGVVTVRVHKGLMVTVSPNPSKGMVTVRRSGTSSVMVQVVDIAGNRVYNKQHAGAQFSLDLSTLPNGFYLLRVGEELQQLVITK